MQVDIFVGRRVSNMSKILSFFGRLNGSGNVPSGISSPYT